MVKPNFDLCELLATRLLSKQNLTTSKVDVRELKYDKNIIFDSIQNYCALTGDPIEKYINNTTQLLSEGCTIYHKEANLYIVLYNDKPQTLEHLNWTLAHEIGHIYLEHTTDSVVEEVEAHFFAAQLLMPEYSLYMMDNNYNSLTVHDVYLVFNVSWSAASKRINTYNKKWSVRCSDEDKKIWDMTKKYINSYYITTKGIGCCI